MVVDFSGQASIKNLQGSHRQLKSKRLNSFVLSVKCLNSEGEVLLSSLKNGKAGLLNSKADLISDGKG